MKLIIVESPAKARTIERFLGDEYTVAASYGHIRDLPSSAGEIPKQFRDRPWARMGVDIENGFDPIYVVPVASKKHVTMLRKLMKQADELLLATDEDREGEAISWHLLEVLAPKVPVKRISFHEITRPAIEKALASPRDVDANLVRAQESRRILDRLFGYSLSPVLWKKVRTKLSAGRVQSVALRLIVEREEARQAFRKAEYYDVEATLQANGLEFTAQLRRLAGQRLAGGKDFDPDTGALKTAGRRQLDGALAQQLAREALATRPWSLDAVERTQTKQRPSPPFTTSTMQQAASRRLRMSPQQSMRVAQRLYEGIDLGGGKRAGLITYMRTDSLTLSELALADTGRLITERFGPDYSSGPRRYKTKSKGAQEAHEAIRPTDVFRTPDELAKYLDKDELALYRLIWNRTVASQMTDAQLDKTAISLGVDCPTDRCVFRANGSIVRFPGFLKVYGDRQKDTLLPELHEGQLIHTGEHDCPVAVIAAEACRHETSPPPRYTEASLIKKLEEAGIGRPSTYAPVISTIQAREYVEKRKNGLLPTYIGLAVTHLLRNHFGRFIDIEFTARMEKDLDDIARGKIDGNTFLSDFYRGGAGGSGGLAGQIESEFERIDYPVIPVGTDARSGQQINVRIGRNYVYAEIEGDLDRRATLPVDLLIDELTAEKALDLIEARARSREPIGADPETGQNIYCLTGPFGPYLQLGEAEGKQKPKRISLGKGTDPTNISLEFALRLLSLPREIGVDPESGKPVRAGIGRFGPYVECNRVYASVENVDELFSVTLDDALEKIRNKHKKPVLREIGTHPETGEPLVILKGRYGPYVTDGAVNANIGRNIDPEAVSLDDAVRLLAEAAIRKKTKKKTAKKTGKKAAKKTAKKAAKKTAKKTAKKVAKKTAKKTAK